MAEPLFDTAKAQADTFMRLAHTPPERLPEGVSVTKGKTPAGGVFTVALFRGGDGSLCPQADAVCIELYECDYRGNALFHTVLNKREAGN